MRQKLIIVLVTGLISACNSGGNTSYSIGGLVSGLNGSGLVLQNNGEDSIAISTNGAFTFPTESSASTFAVTVSGQPSGPSQTCAIRNDTGLLTSNIDNVIVTCTDDSYTLSGTVVGLQGSGLVLEESAGDTLAVNTEGAISFATSILDGKAFSISIKTQPTTPAQTCTLTGGSGTASPTSSPFTIECETHQHSVGGTVTNLSTGELVLTNNASNDTIIAADGNFTFTQQVDDSSAYAVSVKTQPAGMNQHCVIKASSGIALSNINNIAVVCSPPTPTLTLSVEKPKELTFTWQGVPAATHYKLLKSSNGTAAYSQVGTDALHVASNGSYTLTENIAVHLQDWPKARYVLQACYDTACANSDPMSSEIFREPAIATLSVNGNTALSKDGHTIAKANTAEASSIGGINGIHDQLAPNAGAVTILESSGTEWVEQAFIKAESPNAEDLFGYSVALSEDGDTLVVGAPGENSSSTGINSTPDEAATDAGAVYVFTRSNDTWVQHAYIKAPSSDVEDAFGRQVALNAAGNILAVSAPGDDSSTISMDEVSNNDSPFAGVIYIYAFDGTNWQQQSLIKVLPTDSATRYRFGTSLVLDGAGDTLAVNADNDVYIFAHDTEGWSVQKTISSASKDYGDTLALSSDGATIAVAAQKAFNGDKYFEGYSHVDIYKFNATWILYRALHSPIRTYRTQFHSPLALSPDGNVIAIGGQDGGTQWGGTGIVASYPVTTGTYIYTLNPVKAANVLDSIHCGNIAFYNNGSMLFSNDGSILVACDQVY